MSIEVIVTRKSGQTEIIPSAPSAPIVITAPSGEVSTISREEYGRVGGVPTDYRGTYEESTKEIGTGISETTTLRKESVPYIYDPERMIVFFPERHKEKLGSQEVLDPEMKKAGWVVSFRDLPEHLTTSQRLPMEERGTIITSPLEAPSDVMGEIKKSYIKREAEKPLMKLSWLLSSGKFLSAPLEMGYAGVVGGKSGLAKWQKEQKVERAERLMAYSEDTWKSAGKEALGAGILVGSMMLGGGVLGKVLKPEITLAGAGVLEARQIKEFKEKPSPSTFAGAAFIPAVAGIGAGLSMFRQPKTFFQAEPEFMSERLIGLDIKATGMTGKTVFPQKTVITEWKGTIRAERFFGKGYKEESTMFVETFKSPKLEPMKTYDLLGFKSELLKRGEMAFKPATSLPSEKMILVTAGREAKIRKMFGDIYGREMPSDRLDRLPFWKQTIEAPKKTFRIGRGGEYWVGDIRAYGRIPTKLAKAKMVQKGRKGTIYEALESYRPVEPLKMVGFEPFKLKPVKKSVLEGIKFEKELKEALKPESDLQKKIFKTELGSIDIPTYEIGDSFRMGRKPSTKLREIGRAIKPLIKSYRISDYDKPILGDLIRLPKIGFIPTGRMDIRKEIKGKPKPQIETAEYQKYGLRTQGYKSLLEKRPFSIPKVSFRERMDVGQKQIIGEMQSQKQMQKLKTGLLTKTTFRPPAILRTPITPRMSFVPPYLPSFRLPSPFGGGRGRKKRVFGVKPRYKPSLIGVMSGIRIPRMKIPRKLTGIEIRYPVGKKYKYKRRRY